MDVTQILTLALCVQLSVCQPTWIDDVTLCDDVRDYNHVLKTLTVLTQEVKALRTSIQSKEDMEETLHKKLAELPNDFVTRAYFNSRLNNMVAVINRHAEGIEQRIGSQLKIQTSTVEHNADKLELASRMLKFYFSQKFAASDAAEKAFYAQIAQDLQNVSKVISESIMTTSQTTMNYIRNSSEEMTGKVRHSLDTQLREARVTLETSITSANHSLTTDISTLTATAMDALKNIKDILNHHHVTTRLAGGTSPMNGRVEVFLNGVWGTVCDDGWDDLDAEVVCRHLGFCNGTGLTRGFYGPGTGPVILDDVDCQGSEMDIFECHHSGIGVENCDRFEDAAVQCSPCS